MDICRRRKEEALGGGKDGEVGFVTAAPNMFVKKKKIREDLPAVVYITARRGGGGLQNKLEFGLKSHGSSQDSKGRRFDLVFVSYRLETVPCSEGWCTRGVRRGDGLVHLGVPRARLSQKLRRVQGLATRQHLEGEHNLSGLGAESTKKGFCLFHSCQKVKSYLNLNYHIFRYTRRTLFA